MYKKLKGWIEVSGVPIGSDSSEWTRRAWLRCTLPVVAECDEGYVVLVEYALSILSRRSPGETSWYRDEASRHILQKAASWTEYSKGSVFIFRRKDVVVIGELQDITPIEHQLRDPEWNGLG